MFSSYFQNILQSFRWQLGSIATQFPIRLVRLYQHFWSGLHQTWRLIYPDKSHKTQYSKSVQILIMIGAWFGRLAHKIFDLVGLPEIMDFFWQIAKTRTRSLTATEIAEARKVYADSIPYQKIRIDEHSWIAHASAKWLKVRHMGIVLFHTINFTRPIHPAPGNGDMAWLIHELVHVAQMKYVGSQYLTEALHAQLTEGYNYGGPENLHHRNFQDFNREQQGDIAKDYYLFVLYKHINYFFRQHDLSAYPLRIAEMQQGKM